MILLHSTLALAFTTFDINTLQNQVEKSKVYRKERHFQQVSNIPMSAYKTAANGTIATGVEEVSGYSAKIGWGVAVFDIPIEQLFAAINEEEQHTGLSPVSYTKIISGSACQDGRKVLMVLPLSLLSDRWWVTTQSTNPNIRSKSNGLVAELSWIGETNQNDFTLDQESSNKVAGDTVFVSFTQGAWFLIRLDENHTLGEYYNWADPGGNIPAGPASTFAVSSIEDTLQAMNKYAKSATLQCSYRW
jgi:hypothetical protein